MLPMLHSSLLVRTDFTNGDAWQQISDEARRENQDGFRACLEPVSDPAFDCLTWEAVRAAVPADEHGAWVLFIAGSAALTLPDHPVLVVDLLADTGGATVPLHPVRALGCREQPEHSEHGLGGFRERGRRERRLPRFPRVAGSRFRRRTRDRIAA
jgi:hypothetical protein